MEFLRLGVIASTSIVSGLVFYRNFMSRPPRRSSDIAASFFSLNEIVPPYILKTSGMIYSVSLVSLISYLLFRVTGSNTLLRDLTAAMQAAITKINLDPSAVKILKDFISNEARSKFLSFELAMILSILFFFSYIRSSIIWLRDLVQDTLGLERAAESIAREISAQIMGEENSPERALNILERTFGASPRPPEFGTSPNINLVRYVVLFHLTRMVPAHGFDSAVRNMQSKLRINRHPSRFVGLVGHFSTLTLALVFYIIGGVIYWYFVPLLADKGTGTLKTGFGDLTWPDHAIGRQDLRIELVRISLEVVFPMWMGMGLFNFRRARFGQQESVRSTMRSAWRLQVAFSLLCTVCFVVVLAIRSAQSNNGEFYMFSPKWFADTFFPLAIGPLVLFLWIYVRKLGASVYITLCSLLCGVLYSIDEFLYESLANWQGNGFFVHQGILGFWLMFLCTTLWAMCWSKPKLPRDPESEVKPKAAA